jgi:glycosyltransferase involved in cell wall biosynthesis
VGAAKLVTCPRLAVVVLTLNEEVNLPACLGSLEQLDATVLVVDSGSTDRTCEIATGFGATVKQHPFIDYASQRNWAQHQLTPDVTWVLHLDADERLTGEITEEIRSVVAADGAGVDGWYLRKRTVFLGKWIRHGGHYPSFHLRLFRPERGFCEERMYDQHFLVDGQTAVLRNDYIDVVATDIDTWTLRHLRWAKAEAAEILSSNHGSRRVQPDRKGSPVQRRRWLREGVYYRAPLFIRAVGYWFYRYILRLGFLDGWQGFVFHLLQGLWYRTIVDLHLWLARDLRTENELPHPGRTWVPTDGAPELSRRPHPKSDGTGRASTGIPS